MLIQQDMVDSLVPELGDLINEYTGWSASFDEVTVQVVGVFRHWDKVERPVIQKLDVPIKPTDFRSRLELIKKYVVPGVHLATASGITNTVNLYPGNISANEQGLKTLLVHELMHIAQHQQPIYHKHATQALKDMYGTHAFVTDDVDKSYADDVWFRKRSLKYLAEGDAQWVTSRITRDVFPDARSKYSFVPGFFRLLNHEISNVGRVLRGWRRSPEVPEAYTDGNLRIDEIFRQAGRPAVNQLYTLDPYALGDMFGLVAPDARVSCTQ